MLCRDTSRGRHSSRVAWLVYVRTYCVPIATLNQNKRSRSFYLGDAQITKSSGVILKFFQNIFSIRNSAAFPSIG